MNWLIGISVFFAIGKIGVFGLGYGDLEKMFYGSISAGHLNKGKITYVKPFIQG
jgi:hypothetical protein